MENKTKMFPELRNLIVARYQTMENFAKAMKLSQATLSYKLNGKTQWRQNDIVRACDLLNIKDADVSYYFLR